MTEPGFVKKGPVVDYSIEVPLDSLFFNNIEDGIAKAHTILSEFITRMDRIDADILALGESALPQEWMDEVEADVASLESRMDAVEGDNVSDETHRADAALESPLYHFTSAEKAKLAALSDSLDAEGILTAIKTVDGVGSGLDADTVRGIEPETSLTDSDLKFPTSSAVLDAISSSGGGDMLKATYDSNDDGKVDAADSADSVEWDNIQNKPSAFTPTTHTHTESDITDIHTHTNKAILDALTNAGSGLVITDAERTHLETLYSWYEGGGGGEGGYSTPEQILAELLTVDGEGSGLDADKWRGLTPQQLMATQPITTVGTGDSYTYNISDYASDDEAVQAALDAIGVSGAGQLSIMEDITISAKLELPNNILFTTNNHAIIAANGLDDHIITNKDSTNGNSNILIINVVIDGNKDNQTSTLAGNAIHISATTTLGNQHILVQNVKITDSKLNGVYIKNAEHVKLDNVNGVTCGSAVLDHTILLEDINDFTVKNVSSTAPAGCHVKCLDCTFGTIEVFGSDAGSRGFIVSGNSQYVTLTNCLSNGATNDGFITNEEGGVSPSRIAFVHCKAVGGEENGIHLDYGTDHSIIGCWAFENYNNGIRIGGISRIAISDCIIRDNNQELIGGSGILLEESQRCIVANCIVYDSAGGAHQESGIKETLGDYNIFSANNVFDNAVTQISISGEHSFQTTQFDANTLLDLIKTVDGVSSGLDADTWQGLEPTNFATSDALTDHIEDVNNPHSVTASQAGALDLTGGTLTGAVTVTTSVTTPVAVANTTGNNVAIKMSHASISKWLGLNSAGSLVLGDTEDLSTGKVVWHTGNDGSGSGLDADTLRGLNPGDIGTDLPFVTVGNYATCDYYFGDYDSNDAAIQAALTAVTDSTIIYLVSPATITATLLLKSYTRFDGCWNTITVAAGMNDCVFENNDQTGGNTHIGIKNVIIDGNKANQTSGLAAIRFTATATYGNTDITLENVYVGSSWGSGISVTQGRNVTINNTTLVSCGNSTSYHSIVLISCKDVYTDACFSQSPAGCHMVIKTVENSRITCNGYSCGYYGFAIQAGCKHLVMEDCFANASANVAYYVYQVDSVNPEDITFSMCKAFGGSNAGFRFNNGKAINLIGCTVSANASSGIYINGVNQVGIENCDIYNNTVYGINMSNCLRCRIIGNNIFDDQITKTQTAGITESGTSDKNIITNNVVYGNATSQIITVGASTVKANNVEA